MNAYHRRNWAEGVGRKLWEGPFAIFITIIYAHFAPCHREQSSPTVTVGGWSAHDRHHSSLPMGLSMALGLMPGSPFSVLHSDVSASTGGFAFQNFHSTSLPQQALETRCKALELIRAWGCRCHHSFRLCEWFGRIMIISARMSQHETDTFNNHIAQLITPCH